MFKATNNFEDMIRRVGIDSEPRAAHKAKLRWEMLSVFNKQAQRQACRQMKRRKIMRSPIARLTIALTTAAVLIIVITIGAQRSSSHTTTEPGLGRPNPGSTPEPGIGPNMAPLDIELPRKMFSGTKEAIRVANLKKLTNESRPAFLAPVGTKNVALGKPVSSSDEEPIVGEIEMITDGDKEAADGSYVELGPLVQYVTIDLEAMHSIYAIVAWQYHKSERVYFDVVVQVADDPDFITNVRTLFNNDIDNSAGLGVGKNMHYIGTDEGNLINAKGVKARYVRLYSNGNNNNDLNHYIEVEVYGKPADGVVGLFPLKPDLPKPVFGTGHDGLSRIPNMEKPRSGPGKQMQVPVGATIERTLSLEVRNVRFEFVRIEAGKFTMGSEKDSYEKPVHRVRISRGFDIGRTEVTVRQFRAFVDATGYQTDAEKERWA